MKTDLFFGAHSQPNSLSTYRITKRFGNEMYKRLRGQLDWNVSELRNFARSLI
jgi:hypothetical protein